MAAGGFAALVVDPTAAGTDGDQDDAKVDDSSKEEATVSLALSVVQGQCNRRSKWHLNGQHRRPVARHALSGPCMANSARRPVARSN